MFYQAILLLCLISFSFAQTLTAADIPVFDPIEETCASVTVQGCTCADSWDFAGETFTSCSNPNGEQENWCKIDAATCFGPPSGSVEASTLNVAAPSTSVFMATDSPAQTVEQEGYDYGFCAPSGCVKDVCLQAINGASDISTFVQLANAVNIVGLAAGNTILAPTNEFLETGLSALGFDIANLSSQDLATVFELLQGHIIKGFQLGSADLAGLVGDIPTLSATQTLQLDESGALQVVGGTSTAQVIGMVPVDITCNTAILVIDAVLLSA